MASHEKFPRCRRQESIVKGWSRSQPGAEFADAVQAVNRTLVASGQGAPAGHVELLKQKVVTALLRRLDSSLFAHLVQGVTTSSIAAALLLSNEGLSAPLGLLLLSNASHIGHTDVRLQTRCQ